MKKKLDKEDLAVYIESLPASTFVGLSGAGEYLRKKAAETVRKESDSGMLGGTFYAALQSAFSWSVTEQGSLFWNSLQHTFPLGPVIEIPDPLPESVISSPLDPRALPLVGKEVYFGNWPIHLSTGPTARLNGLRAGGEPFGIGTGNGIVTEWFKYIEAVPETVEVTMDDVCKVFGKNVKIKKE